MSCYSSREKRIIILFEKFRQRCNIFYLRCKAYQQERYYDCLGIIVEEKRLLPNYYYYLYPREKISQMEEELRRKSKERGEGL